MMKKARMDKFTGTIKFTPKYAKCEPLLIYGNWELKDIGKPYKVWCNDGLYKNGINENFCEIIRAEEKTLC